MAKLFANSGDPDQTPRSAASDLGLHCLPITLLRVSGLQWVKYGTTKLLIMLIQTLDQVNITTCWCAYICWMNAKHFCHYLFLIIWIKYDTSCINICQLTWKVLKTEAEGRGLQHLPRDLANVNALKNHVRSLLLHKN